MDDTEAANYKKAVADGIAEKGVPAADTSTIGFKIWAVWFHVRVFLVIRWEKRGMWVANHLPRKIVYWAAIRVWQEAVTDEWGFTDAHQIKMHEGIKRWRNKKQPKHN